MALSDVQNQEPERRSGNYSPSVWGEHFLSYSKNALRNSNETVEQDHEGLKEMVRKMITKTSHKSWQRLELIDTIQRLGVSYHFQREIEAALLEHIQPDDNIENLYSVALHFRLMRQQGHHVPCHVFEKFKDSEGGGFKDSLVSDVRGLLSLFEATHFRVHGEDILEEALSFTASQLKSRLSNLNDSMALRIKQTLEMPVHKTLTRIGARQYISLYQLDESHDSVLLNFAKLDFNILQSLHQTELSAITKWWKELDCPNKLPFARDRIVECYFWMLGVYFEPKFSFARTTMTKVIALTSILDDIYDVYATFDELIIFTDSIERWHITASDHLPPYLRHYYAALLSVYSEMEKSFAKDGKSNMVNYAISAMKSLARAYFEEAKWFFGGKVPNFEEYMEVALVTAAYKMLATNFLVCMGEFVNEDILDWIAENPLVLRASSVICRLMDDIVSCEKEKERGEVAKGVECYMKQYGASKEEAVTEFEKQITNAWKDINTECLSTVCAKMVFQETESIRRDQNSGSESEGIEMVILERILNLSRVIHLLYTEEDGYTHSSTKVKLLITSILVDPFPSVVFKQGIMHRSQNM